MCHFQTKPRPPKVGAVGASISKCSACKAENTHQTSRCLIRRSPQWSQMEPSSSQFPPISGAQRPKGDQRWSNHVNLRKLDDFIWFYMILMGIIIQPPTHQPVTYWSIFLLIGMAKYRSDGCPASTFSPLVAMIFLPGFSPVISWFIHHPIIVLFAII